jgi:hypothetical protein
MGLLLELLWVGEVRALEVRRELLDGGDACCQSAAIAGGGVTVPS